MLDNDHMYEGREQSRVKHGILSQYLESFAHIVAFKWPSITYVDGFSGPWNARSSDLSDTSFAIALNQLRRARKTHQSTGKDLKLRCAFVEKDPAAYQRLKEFAESVDDAEVHTIPGEFESAIPQIIEFVRKGGDTFPFILIDPTGPSGFAMKTIAPLLSLDPGEVLINFMLEFIRRFIEQRGLRALFEELFGTDDFDESLNDLDGIDRDDAITEKYCLSLSRFCGYPHVLRASVLHPDKDRLNFQLIYGTRHPKGVEEFKKAEKKAMHIQETARARVEEDRKKKRSGGQTSFLVPNDMPESQYYEKLRERYQSQAKNVIVSIVNSNRRVPYDELWLAALSFPMVWKDDLTGWLKEWRTRGSIEYAGLKPREKTLKRDEGHFIVRNAESVY